jgi:hypothetical protein
MNDEAKFPTVHPAKLEELKETLDAVSELDEAKNPSRQLALTALISFFRSLGLDSEILLRLWKQQEELDRLKKNLRQHADTMKDPLQATLFTLAHIRIAFEPLGIESVQLAKLENALSNVFDGHSHPLFKPDIHNRPAQTWRQRKPAVFASALMQLHMEENGGDTTAAAKKVLPILTRGGFKLSGGASPKAETIKEWRKKLLGSTADPRERDWYASLTRESPSASRTRESPIDCLFGLKEIEEEIEAQRRKERIKTVERLLTKAVAEAK